MLARISRIVCFMAKTVSLLKVASQGVAAAAQFPVGSLILQLVINMVSRRSIRRERSQPLRIIPVRQRGEFPESEEVMLGCAQLISACVAGNFGE